MPDFDAVINAGKETLNGSTPLWLPEGSVRAVLALIVTGTSCYLVATGVAIPEWFMLTFTGTVVGYFFSRTNNTPQP